MSNNQSESHLTRPSLRGLLRREQLLEVATEKFLLHGYSGVSVDDIVREVGGSKSSVYSHFGQKEGLFITVIEGLCNEFLRDIKKVDLSGLGAEAGLLRLGQALLTTLLQERHIAFQRLVIAESGRFPALGQTWFNDGPQQSRQMIAQFLTARQLAGELRAASPSIAAMLFHDMLVFNPTHLSTIARPLTPKKVRAHVRQVVTLFLRGMRQA